MSIKAGYRIRPAAADDYRQMAGLIQCAKYVHRHFDWIDPLEWLGQHPFLIVEQNDQIMAVLSCPPDPLHNIWVRLFICTEEFSLRQAWFKLWEAARSELGKGNHRIAACVSAQAWCVDILRSSGFFLKQDIILLKWFGNIVERESRPPELNVRSMNEMDLEQVLAIDHSAFEPLWRNSFEALQHAYRQSAIATVVEKGGKVCGFQMSTQNSRGGHLARLAVQPEEQRHGIARVLVEDLLQAFIDKGINYLTVNTQGDNLASFALYRKFKFQETIERYHVYMTQLQ